ncbi:ion transporter [Streptomyces genisteinicus]|uniref:Ion transporter n=1 Tax=Streptomyces genisteinicus TaxID=2768068 RepID=A0A7H0I0X2_9ACTN|nr:ion transporter [Streptomyces genisteinicus]QNP66438.1 ion transporter [Streptomyces genisteinicus]
MSLDSPALAGMTGRRARLAARAGRLVEAEWFTALAVTAIALNAVLLGAETYAGFAREWHTVLGLLEQLLLGAFAVEIALRALAHADRPADFLRNPWNVFDLAVVLCAFLPFVSENTTVLRLLRLARVIRTARFLPQLRIIVTALGKSVPGAVSFLLVGTLLLYLYAMLGWAAFAADDPEHYGSLGRAALTLFVLMTLDGLGDALYGGLAISPWAVVYYASYVLLSSFLMVNLLIGVVIDSLAQARELDEKRRPAGGGPAPAAVDELRERITAARAQLEDLENLLPHVPPQQEAVAKTASRP